MFQQVGIDGWGTNSRKQDLRGIYERTSWGGGKRRVRGWKRVNLGKRLKGRFCRGAASVTLADGGGKEYGTV